MRRVRDRALALALGLAGLAGGCGEPTAPADLRPSLVVVTIDTLRADHLGCYGYFRDTSPHIDALAARSLLFEDCQAPVAQTLPSHTSLFTGLAPLEHGVGTNIDQAGGTYVPVETIHTIAQTLSRAGYATAGFVSAEPVKRASGLGTGFATWHEPERATARAEDTIDAALAWLDARPPGPFFLWVHLWDAHLPYEPPPPYDRRFVSDEALDAYLLERRFMDTFQRTRGGHDIGDVRVEHDLYDGEIRYVDDQLGRLFARFDERDLWPRTAVVVTADHGEGMGQHYMMGHGWIWLEQLHVPVIAWIPGGEPARVDRPLGIADVLPTVLARLPGIPADELLVQASGRDVLAASEPIERHSQLPSSRRKQVHSITVDGWRLIEGLVGRDRLFDLTSDPYELENLAGARPEKVEELKARLHALVARQTARGEAWGAGQVRPADAARRANLEALGYGGEEDEAPDDGD